MSSFPNSHRRALQGLAHFPHSVAASGFVGYLHPGFDIGVLALDGRALPAGELGIVKARVKREGGGQEPWIDHGDVGWTNAEGALYIVGRTADIDDLSRASVRDISPVHDVEHLLRLEWDASDAAAVLVDEGDKPEIWVGTVDCNDADAKTLETILRQEASRAQYGYFR